MKRKQIEKLKPSMPKENGYRVTVQEMNDILILNLFWDRKMYARHCVNTDTGEYATFQNGKWFRQKLEGALGAELYMYASYGWYSAIDKYIEKFKPDKEGKDLLSKKLRISRTDGIREYATEISRLERDYNENMRNKTEENRLTRVEQNMKCTPKMPADIWDWINKTVFGEQDYMTKNADGITYTCSSCGRRIPRNCIKGKDNELMKCPACHSEVTIKKRSSKMSVISHFTMIQPVNEQFAMERHFDVRMESGEGRRKKFYVREKIRILLLKNRKGWDIYYCQYYAEKLVEKSKSGVFDEWFDNKSNRASQRFYSAFLYDGGIKEAFEDTIYEPWSRLFTQLAAAGLRIEYNRLMMANANSSFISLIEMLFRNRFYRILQEESLNISPWSFEYCGDMNLAGNGIEEVFGIRDRQKINRIRDRNGGNVMVEWMRYSDTTGNKISDRVLSWADKNNVEPDEIPKTKMSMEQMMNYIERQRKEGYKGKSAGAVIEQYKDYMEMCKKLKKNLKDEMIYRPRELKRRHDEAVIQIEMQNAKVDAEEYSRKFPEVEKVLKEIKSKLEYVSGEYLIMVPKKVVDIVLEGRALHHCAGSTDRYFDRMKSHETYICFLRRTDEPEIPFYTIEVEPGGTIRQHRGLYDEEPGIEEIKPFLKEWQKEIKKRMSEEDHNRAAVSRKKREENILELKQKNNTRVLEGLMEDFMEAM